MAPYLLLLSVALLGVQALPASCWPADPAPAMARCAPSSALKCTRPRPPRPARSKAGRARIPCLTGRIDSPEWQMQRRKEGGLASLLF